MSQIETISQLRNEAAELLAKAAAIEAQVHAEQRAEHDQQIRIQIDERTKRWRARAKELAASGMRCNCDLDNWTPEPTTGHSWVCRIHKQVMSEGGEA